MGLGGKGRSIMASYSKAIIKDAIRGTAPAGETAPCGEYDVTCKDGCVGLCNCNDKRAFTLSVDAFIQHLYEGRIALAS